MRGVGALVLTLVGSLALSPIASAQGEKKVIRLRTLNPGDVLYVMLDGGGNSLALIGDKDLVLIDTKSPGWGAAIVEAVNDSLAQDFSWRKIQCSV